MTYIAILDVNTYDRQAAEAIEGMNFNTLVEVQKLLPYVEYYSLTEFAELCNNTDNNNTDFNIGEVWVSYIEVING